ncbi:four helix bundle protein [Photobacterium sp. OFAV2-7]|uniref:four helix bundle protein n=1 Tax=Photobacterium sp. OFAV2-7 TaxID=2917748 RepID=UPI001EF513EB|nr:four helix bundle protein [Photobacterium sp. OFAV2-7]MCG7588158.1 four helix bundle protein [Photobacterium sp. OFAV2-7]
MQRFCTKRSSFTFSNFNFVKYAEGSERRTTKGNVEFFYITKGSCGELVTQLMFARDLGYFSEATANEMICNLIEVSRMIGGLIKYQSLQIQEKRGEY